MQHAILIWQFCRPSHAGIVKTARRIAEILSPLDSATTLDLIDLIPVYEIRTWLSAYIGFKV